MSQNLYIQQFLFNSLKDGFYNWYEPICESNLEELTEEQENIYFNEKIKNREEKKYKRTLEIEKTLNDNCNFSSIPLDKDIKLRIDIELGLPLGVYYIKDKNNNIEEIGIVEYGEIKHLYKKDNSTLYYSSELVIINRKKFKLIENPLYLIIALIALVIPIIMCIKNILEIPTVISIIVVGLLAIIYDLINKKHEQQCKREKCIFEIGAYLKTLEINYNYLFLYNSNTHFNTIEGTENVLKCKTKYLKTHPMFYDNYK